MYVIYLGITFMYLEELGQWSCFCLGDALYAIKNQGQVYKLRDDQSGLEYMAHVESIRMRHVFPALVVSSDNLHF